MNWNIQRILPQNQNLRKFSLQQECAKISIKSVGENCFKKSDICQDFPEI